MCIFDTIINYVSNRVRNKIEERETKNKNKLNLRRCIMKEKITKIKASRKRGTKQGVKHSKDLYVGRILSIDGLKKHSSLTPLFSPEFQSKGGMISL